MRVKLTDVAKLAGVSVTTVSRVINNKGYLSDETIKKVNQAIDELNYQPNTLARSLQGKSTNLIGLVFPSLSNIFYAELIDSLEQELFQRGYKTIFCNSQYQAEKERDYIRMLQANQVEGIIVGSHSLTAKDYENIYSPVVSFDRYLGKNIPIVSSDNYSGGQMATRQLLNHNIKKVIMITGTNDKASPTYQRYQGYLDVMKQEGFEPIWHALSDIYSPIRKKAELKQILEKEKPEGIFCSDDMTALLIYNLAQEMGLSLPKDLKLIGYDGTHVMEHYFPSITTVQQPIKDLSQLCVELLVDKIDEKKPSQMHYELPVRLISGITC